MNLDDKFRHESPSAKMQQETPGAEFTSPWLAVGVSLVFFALLAVAAPVTIHALWEIAQWSWNLID